MKIFLMEKDSEIPALPPVSGAGGKHNIAQTYAEDMAKVIEDDKGGLIKKIIHGEEEREARKRNMSPESKKNRLFMLVSLLLVLMGLATLFFFFFKKDNSTVLTESQFAPIIFNDKSAFFEVKGFNKDEITQTVLNEINTTQVKTGGIEGIYLTINKQILGLREFIILIKSNFIPGDNTFFINNNFLLGVVNAETKDFFILLKVRSTVDIFDAVRAWEGKMFSDLHGFFGVSISPETQYLLTKEFQDGIVQNKNVRILYDNENKIIMMYIFADDTSVIITNTENATQEIMLRLASSQIKK